MLAFYKSLEANKSYLKEGAYILEYLHKMSSKS